MAGTKISELPSASTLTGSEVIPVVQSGATKQALVTALPYVPTGTGAVTTTIESKLRENVSLKDFGAVGDGVTDDTLALDNAINWINNNGGTLTAKPGTYFVGPNTAVTANNVTFLFESVVFLAKPGSLGAFQALINVTGNNFTMVGATIDGNQANFTSAPVASAAMLNLSGAGHKLDRVSCINSPARGANLYCSNSEFINCNFDNNANLGFEAVTVSYIKFIGCSFNVNGCGFQQTRTVPSNSSHGFAAFGHALRYRSHHVEFIDCEAKLNGREGYYCGQGTYSIKYIGCLAWANDDGGFTLNNDPLGSGLPGDGESCYDVEYIDCEAYNNYNSGIFTSAPMTNISVIGGRYYNNHRLAGSLPQQTGYPNGIYIAGNSQSILIQGAKTYDERQYRTITTATVSGSTCVIASPGWVPGTKDYYPKVAFISGADGSFQGYGKIVAESAGSVTVETLAYNGVTLAAIGSSMYVTQRVQHNGVFFDNGAQAYVNVDSFGEVKGPTPSIQGFKVGVGSFANGQNVIVENGVEKLEPELLGNSTFDVDILNWTFSTPGGGSATRMTTGVLKSAAALRLIGGSSAAEGDATLLSGALNSLSGSFFRYGFWVYGDARADATLSFFWTIGGSTFSTTATHPGGGWRYLMIAGYVPEGATAVIARIVAAANKTTYWDTGSLRAYSLKTDSRDFSYSSRSLPV
jgi:hypothetical protein